MLDPRHPRIPRRRRREDRHESTRRHHEDVLHRGLRREKEIAGGRIHIRRVDVDEDIRVGDDPASPRLRRVESVRVRDGCVGLERPGGGRGGGVGDGRADEVERRHFRVFRCWVEADGGDGAGDSYQDEEEVHLTQAAGAATWLEPAEAVISNCWTPLMTCDDVRG